MLFPAYRVDEERGAKARGSAVLIRGDDGDVALQMAKTDTRRFTKSNLPAKPCLRCGRPFEWRKKWARDWENVRYCSKRCAGEKPRRSDQVPSEAR